MGLELAHVSVNRMVRPVDCHIIVLVAVARIDHDRLIQVLYGEVGADLPQGITIRAIGEGEKLERFSRHEIFDHVTAAIPEFTGRIHVGRISVAELRASQINVHGGEARVDEHIGDPCLGHADLRLGVSEVQKTSR